jgi:hypothetical protein
MDCEDPETHLYPLTDAQLRLPLGKFPSDCSMNDRQNELRRRLEGLPKGYFEDRYLEPVQHELADMYARAFNKEQLISLIGSVPERVKLTTQQGVKASDWSQKYFDDIILTALNMRCG